MKLKDRVPHRTLYVANCTNTWWMFFTPPKSTRHSALCSQYDPAHCPAHQRRFVYCPSTARSALVSNLKVLLCQVGLLKARFSVKHIKNIKLLQMVSLNWTSVTWYDIYIIITFSVFLAGFFIEIFQLLDWRWRVCRRSVGVHNYVKDLVKALFSDNNVFEWYWLSRGTLIDKYVGYCTKQES